MIYDETSGTSPDPIYETEVVVTIIDLLLLETGAFLLLETGGFILLENSVINDTDDIYGNSSGADPDSPFETESDVGTPPFSNTTGTSPDPIYEEN